MACRDETKSSDTDTQTEEIEVVKDNDGDGYLNSEDCDDGDPGIHPGADELCDGIDNNCDGQADEEVTETFYADSDGDGFGNESIQTEACTVPDGYVSNGSDCDDTHAETYPSAEEICDGLDNNCDGTVDEDLLVSFYVDNDQDGYGDESLTAEACAPAFGLSLIAGDCDDTDPEISPAETEICDEIDNNCDGEIDEGTLVTYYPDQDEDGFGDDSLPMEGCDVPSGHVTTGGDCDDLETYAHPIMIEFCDEIDNDCNGQVDESGSIGESTFWLDSDGDGYGDPNQPSQSCSIPVGHVDNDEDCSDTNASVSPLGTEICNNTDDDCDSMVDEDATDAQTFYADYDSDGYGDAGNTTLACTMPTDFITDSTDCDDNDNDIHPGADEICNGEDDNCDGTVDTDAIDTTTWYLDSDSDGFGDPAISVLQCNQPAGYTLDQSDCNDSDANINPDADEICDAVDQNCDGDIHEDAVDGEIWYLDADADGYGNPSDVLIQCDAPAGYTADATDCDDNNQDINPGAVEVCDGVDNNCDFLLDEQNGLEPSCAAASCQSILDEDPGAPDGLYWLDSDNDGDTSNAWEAYCDMSRDGGGWTKIESATFPFFFDTSNWFNYGLANSENYSNAGALDDFSQNGEFTLRFEVGDSGNWTDAVSRDHYTIWSQGHNPFTSTTDGSDYTYISGEESTTCSGFNGLHNIYQSYSLATDVDSGDAAGCWWMQVIPISNYNCCGGYLDGYNGAHNGHNWQAVWVR